MLNHLHDGLLLENLGVTIPWLISRPDLFQVVPETAFTHSTACWPMMRCTVLGIDLVWGFNFVTHASERFIGLRYDGDTETSQKTFEVASAHLLTHLGTPNRVNSKDSCLRWRDDWVCVMNSIGTRREPNGRKGLRHELFIYALSKNPTTLAYHRDPPANQLPRAVSQPSLRKQTSTEMSADEIVSQVAWLLELFPSVCVVNAVHDDAKRQSYFKLGIMSLLSLARIVRHCVGANVRLDVHAANFDNPVDENSLDFSIVVPDDDGRGGFDNPPAPLQFFGIYLARDLKRLMLLPADEADAIQRAWNAVVM